MSGPLVGHARVEVEGDLGQFADRTRSRINEAMGHVEGEVRQGFRRTETTAAGAGDTAGQSYAQRAGSKIKAGLSKIKDAAGGILGDLGLGAALAASFSGALNQAQNSEMIAAKLGVSSSDARKYGQIAGHIYSNAWGDSLDDVSAAVANVKQQLGDLVDDSQLEGLTTKALAFQQSFGVETTESIKAVGQMLRTGLAKNANEAFDILTKGEQNGADKAGDLIDTFNEYGTQFRKLGIDGPAALGLISQGLKGGARDSDLVADSLKEFAIRAVDGSKTTAAGFKAIGLNGKQMAADVAAGGPRASAALQMVLDHLRNIHDPAKRAQAAVALFGTQAEDMGGALYKLNPATAAASKGMHGLAGASDEMTKHAGNATPPLEALRRSVMGTLTTVASKALPVLQPFFSLLSRMGPAVAGLVIAFAGMVIVTKVASSIQTFNEVVLTAEVRARLAAVAARVWAAAQVVLNAVMSANPIALVVIAIAALVAAFVIAYKHSETFRKIVAAAWDWIKRAAAVAWNILKAIFRVWLAEWRVVWTVIRTGASIIAAAFRGIAAGMRWVWNNVLRPIWSLLKAQWRVVWTVVRTIGRAISAAFRGIGAGLQWVWRNVISPVWGWIKHGIGVLRDTIKRVVGVISGLWRGIGSGLSWAYNHTIAPILHGISSAISGVESALDSLNGKRQATFKPGWDSSTPGSAGALEHHAAGGRLGRGWNIVGEAGIEAIWNGPSGQQVFGADTVQHLTGTTSAANSRADGGGESSAMTRLHPDDLAALARIVWSRPAEFKVGARVLARAVNDGQRELARL